jgi:hypothetical protein
MFHDRSACMRAFANHLRTFRLYPSVARIFEPGSPAAQFIVHATSSYISACSDLLSLSVPGTAPQVIVERNRIPVKFPHIHNAQKAPCAQPSEFSMG